ncbi:MAG TPA: MFS transporter [Candidatus Dormibacteraeota bacterium]|nr:MFS transporter [Candidatus Dormibacteraeota bacterium]
MTTAPNGDGAAPETGSSAAAVLRNRPFLLLWLSQVSTQIGVNMVLYGLTVIVLSASNLTAAVSGLFLTFLVPSVLLSALAGVYVDRIDRRTVLVVSNALRAAILVAIFAAGNDVGMLLLLNTVFSVVTVFFAPAEAAMIPVLVPREQLLAANGIFTLTLNGAFALGYALLAPLVVTIGGGPQPLIIIVASLFALAAVFCLTLPSDPPIKRPRPGSISAVTGAVTGAVSEAGQAVGGVFSQLREGIQIIRDNRTIAWSLAYLGISASLIGVVAVLGPSFARDTLGLSPKDLIVVVLPLGIGIVMGVLLLNNYGKYIARRRAIEIGLVILGVLLVVLTVAGPVSRLLTGVGQHVPVVDLSSLTSLVSVVVAIAFLAGVCYGIVAISAQVQLQEDIPPDGRGRVFGVLNMLISVASILPIIVVGQIADWVGTTAVILGVAAFVGISGVVSIVSRGPIQESEGRDLVSEIVPGAQLDPTGANLPMQRREPHGHSHREAHRHGEAHGGRPGELDDHRDGDVGL